MRMPFIKTDTLPRLKLELLHRGWRRQLGGLLMLSIGVVLALAVLLHYLQTSRRIDLLENGAAQAAATPASDATPADPDEIKAVQDGIDRLALPWGALFTALEAAATDKISLISVDPDAAQGTLTLAAEAPDVYEMLAYVKALSAQKSMRNVVLDAYEVQTEQANQTVRFTLTARWKEAS